MTPQDREARREIAVEMMKGLLSGNSLIMVPTDEMCYAYARDAVRMADALMVTLEEDNTPDMYEPTEMKEAIYPGDARRIEELAAWDAQERKARGEDLIGTGLDRSDPPPDLVDPPPESFYIDPSRIDVGSVSAPVPERDPRS